MSPPNSLGEGKYIAFGSIVVCAIIVCVIHCEHDIFLNRMELWCRTSLKSGDLDLELQGQKGLLSLYFFFNIVPFEV